MTLIEKVFTLQSINPFENLKDAELILTANVIKIKKYKEKELIIPKEMPLNYLILMVNGVASTKSGKEFKSLFGARELLSDILPKEDLVAKDEVEVMLINKAHFFTLLYECPDLMLGFLNLLDTDRIES